MEGHHSEKTCRTCLRESDELTSLYAKDDDAGPTLLKKLRFCVSMEVLVSEHKPSNACSQCVRCIAEYYDFKRRCELSEKTLEDLCYKLSEYTITKEEVILKEEESDDAKKDPDDSNYLCSKPSAIDEVDDRDEEDANSTVDAKTESDDFNWSCDDDSNWTPCFDEVVDGKLMLGCDQCDKKFPYPSALKTHKQKHRRQGFECDICKRSIKMKGDLPRHIRTHIVQRRRCDGCDKLFDSSAAMLKHRAGAHPHLGPYDNGGKNQLKCMVCEKTFDVRVDLNRHLITHAAEHRFKCGACGELFETQSQMEAHEQALHNDRTESGPAVEPKISCDQCDKEFETLSKFKKHRKVHSDRRDFECRICKNSFKFGHDLRRHVRRHLMQKRRCDGCNKLFDSLSEMRAHRASAHPHLDPYGDKGKNKVKCGLCEKTFDCQADLWSHTREHLRKCYKCGELFETILHMQMHACDCQELPCNDAGSGQTADNPQQGKSANPDLGQDDSKEKEPSNGDEVGQSESNLKFACETCGKQFKRTYDFNRHLKVHEKPHCCPACGERFKSAEERSTHIQTCRDKDDKKLTSSQLGDRKEEQTCNMCSRSYPTIKRLKEHQWRYHLRPKTRCNLCGASFSQACYLRIHMERHNVQRTKFVCETCGKAYSHQVTLRIHIEENHAAEPKVYECKVCGKQYNVFGSHAKHMRLHRQQRSEYECRVCKKRFEFKMRLDDHMKRHNKRHGCDVCDRQFLSPMELKKHKLCHARHAAKPYGCKLCTKRFSTAAAVSFHMRTLHNAKKHLKCDVCGMEFYNRFHYAAHYSKHTGVKPYQCDICGKGYNYNQDFIPHRKQCAAQKEKSLKKEAEVTSTSAS